MSIYLEIALLIFVYVTSWYVIAQILRDNSIMDIAWGLGFVMVTGYIIQTRLVNSTYQVIAFVTILWGLRLAIYLAIRWKRQAKEDWRYQNWRNDWGKHYWWKAYFNVFLLQGMLMWMIALPLMRYDYIGEPTILTIIGAVISLIGITWQAIADWQLLLFKKNPNNKGQIIQSGLWALSRHPNYFGELLMWWGVFISSTAFGNWWAIISPLTISCVLVFISTPMLETKMQAKSTFKPYAQKVPNRFIPKLF